MAVRQIPTNNIRTWKTSTKALLRIFDLISRLQKSRLMKKDSFLAVGLGICFTLLCNIQNPIVVGNRDVLWLLVILAGASIHALGAKKTVRISTLRSLVRLEAILLISQLVGFLLYVIRSKALQ